MELDLEEIVSFKLNRNHRPFIPLKTLNITSYS